MTALNLLILALTTSLTIISIFVIIKFLQKIVNGNEVHYIFDYLLGILLFLLIGGFSIYYMVKILTVIGLI